MRKIQTKSNKNYLLFLLAFFLLSANIANAYDYKNPFNGVWSVTDLLGKLLVGIQGIVGLIAIGMLIVAGIIYIFSGVNPELMTTAKNMAKWAISGFTIAVAIPSLLKEIIVVMTANPSTSADLVDNAKGIYAILLDVLRFLLTIIGVLALISFVVGGLQYLTSAGDKTKAENAKKIVLYSIIGVLVSGSGAIIIRQIFKFLAG